MPLDIEGYEPQRERGGGAFGARHRHGGGRAWDVREPHGEGIVGDETARELERKVAASDRGAGEVAWDRGCLRLVFLSVPAAEHAARAGSV